MTTNAQTGAFSQPVADALYWEKVRRARAMPPEEKLLAGELLFNYACEITLAGIRSQHPDYSETQCLDELKRRLALRESMERKSNGN